MKRQLLPAIVFTMTISIACHKDPVSQPEPPITSTVLKLKDINDRNLPSPFYHFEYDAAGNITLVGFQSGLRIYKVNYNGKNIESMEDTTDPTNKVRLEYVYNNGELLAVKVYDKNGIVVRHCIFSFSPSQQLQQMDWDVADGSIGFYLEETLTFSYYPDGNLMEMVTHNYPVGSEPGFTYSDRFENYDDKPNAGGFTLLHTNPHDLVLLPGLKFQINNPRRNIHTGDGINYDVQYNYTYDSKKRPTVKTGDLNVTNGSNAGQHFETQSTFSYYD
jgi:hypothetical protein